MIEILEMKDKPEKLEITPQLAIAAHNVRVGYCSGDDCEKCVFNQLKVAGIIDPEEMPCLPAGKVINIPILQGNTVTYFDDNKLHRTTCGNRQEAEELLEKVRKRK